MDIRNFKVACSNCNLKELCMPVGLSFQDIEKIDQLVETRKKIKKGEHLFHNGQKFNALYAIRTGVFKTVISSEDGREQVTGFQMAGEVMGLDGIATEHHTCDAIALEDAETCMMPFDKLEFIAHEVNALQHHLYKIMSREIVNEHNIMMLLGSMKAEEKLAAFILNISQRMKSRGFSASEINLRMSREEIGSYLGLKIETVSRTFTKLEDDGIIKINNKSLSVTDMSRLQNLISSRRDC
jgi:CRP/FNR family transcriptional regulator